LAAHTEILLGGIEAGGTKFICGVGSSPDAILRECRIPTTTPEQTLGAAIAFFQDAGAVLGPIGALGIASFGPIALRREYPNWGHLLATTKPGWSGADLAGPLAAALNVPVALDTDVNGAALAEHRLGAGRGLASLAYVTVGTGIGAGLIVDGRPVHGLVHPEIGHLRPRRPAEDMRFAGICPFHGDCFEGVASGGAIGARSGAGLDALPADHPAWEIEADYLGQLCATLVLAVSPELIVLGGGVMQQKALFPMIRRRFDHWLKGYPDLGSAGVREPFVVPPALGGRAGLVGALLLAEAALQP
jgi:fructokinase